ncbi:unnamed protein product, partial [Rhizoctonia solani]
ALLSNSEVCLFDIHQLQAKFEGSYVSWEDLIPFAQRYTVLSFIVSFAFDVGNSIIATISVDSVLCIWSTEASRTVWKEKIPGEGDPSSVDIVDNGVIIGRNKGNTIQILALRSANVLSTFHLIQTKDPKVQ